MVKRASAGDNELTRVLFCSRCTIVLFFCVCCCFLRGCAPRTVEFVFFDCVPLEALCLCLCGVCFCVFIACCDILFSYSSRFSCPPPLCGRNNCAKLVVETCQGPSLPNQHMGRSTLSKCAIQPLVEPRRRVERVPKASSVSMCIFWVHATPAASRKLRKRSPKSTNACRSIGTRRGAADLMIRKYWSKALPQANKASPRATCTVKTTSVSVSAALVPVNDGFALRFNVFRVKSSSWQICNSLFPRWATRAAFSALYQSLNSHRTCKGFER